MKPLPFTVREQDKVRVILSTDAKNEADDQFAIAYAMMSPKLDMVGIVASHFYPSCFDPNSPHFTDDFRLAATTMDRSFDEIKLVLSKMGISDRCPVLHGAVSGLENEHLPKESEGADYIIEQAHTPGAPLYVVGLGAATDIASAYLKDPSIAEGIEGVVWVGGTSFPVGGPEFNLENDIAAGNVLMDSDLKLFLLPNSSTVSLEMSYAEMFYRVYPCGEIGKYLCDQLIEFSKTKKKIAGESWTMWDLAGISVLLYPYRFQYQLRNAPRITDKMNYIEVPRKHEIRVYGRIEPRIVMEDFYCKLALSFC